MTTVSLHTVLQLFCKEHDRHSNIPLRKLSPMDTVNIAGQANQTVHAGDVQAGDAASGPAVSGLRSLAGVSGDGDQRGAARSSGGITFRVRRAADSCIVHAPESSAPGRRAFQRRRRSAAVARRDGLAPNTSGGNPSCNRSKCSRSSCSVPS